tara:strand:+ start:91 stop:480 length:390 start_codon:yes stop_codon:yes gene_type:complete
MYEPEVDDYVIWDRGEYGTDEGWVYFKGDPVDNELRIKHGWNPAPRYITIETGVRPKPDCEYSKNDPHKYIHTLLLCYDINWHQLKFVKRRNSKVIQHYSQYDDIAGIEETGDKLSKMYKSQDGRLPDY